MNSLNDECVTSADVFQDSHEDIAFAEDLGLARSQLYSQLIGDRLGKYRVSGSGQNRQVALRCLELLDTWSWTLLRRFLVHWS